MYAGRARFDGKPIDNRNHMIPIILRLHPVCEFVMHHNYPGQAVHRLLISIRNAAIATRIGTSTLEWDSLSRRLRNMLRVGVTVSITTSEGRDNRPHAGARRRTGSVHKCHVNAGTHSRLCGLSQFFSRALAREWEMRKSVIWQ